jgi:predicted phosphodiesterase
MGEAITHGSTVVRTVGVIGDVHTERARLAGAIAYFSTLGLDLIVCTGDLPDGPGLGAEVDACCMLLAQAGVLTAGGNHDRWLLDGDLRDLPLATLPEDVSAETLAFLRALPQTAEIATPDGLALLCHGLGTDDMVGVLPFDHAQALEDNAPLQALLAGGRYRYLINGHTHRPMVRSIEGLTIVNAGTLLREHDPCCAVVDFGARTARFFDVGPDGAVTAGETHEL